MPKRIIFTFIALFGFGLSCASLAEGIKKPIDFIAPPANIESLARKLAYKDFPKAVDILAIIRVESAFKPKVVSHDYPNKRKLNPKLKTTTSVGLMQVQGGSFDIAANMQEGVRRLRYNFERFHSIEAAVKAYNIGPGNYKFHRLTESGADYWKKYRLRRAEYVHYYKSH